MILEVCTNGASVEIEAGGGDLQWAKRCLTLSVPKHWPSGGTPKLKEAAGLDSLSLLPWSAPQCSLADGAGFWRHCLGVLDFRRRRTMASCLTIKPWRMQKPGVLSAPPLACALLLTGLRVVKLLVSSSPPRARVACHRRR